MSLCPIVRIGKFAQDEERAEEKRYLLQTPPHEHLRKRFVILLGQSCQYRFISPHALHKRRIRLHHDIVLAAPVHDVFSRKPGVDFVLAYGDFASAPILDVFVELLEVMNAIIRNAYRANFARLLCFN